MTDDVKAGLREHFLEAMRFRHACRAFEPGRRVAQEDIEYVLEAGRLSPSSLGLEHWRFVVVQDPALKEALQEACMGQPQVGSSSAVIVILAREQDLAPDGEYVTRMFRRMAPAAAEFTALLDFYRHFAEHNDLTAWSIAQCHIAAANMMTAAAVIGVDSCPIGAFSASAVLDALGITSRADVVALVVALGYRERAPAAKKRLPLSEIVEYR
ncbi:MAG: NAD(P)H-dependent oxidoreductase [Casimicrobiaceae bacterium]